MKNTVLAPFPANGQAFNEKKAVAQHMLAGRQQPLPVSSDADTCLSPLSKMSLKMSSSTYLLKQTTEPSRSSRRREILCVVKRKT